MRPLSVWFCGLMIALCTSVAHAQLKVVAYWRLGDDDKEAKAGEPIVKTVDKSLSNFQLGLVGKPVYSSDVSDKAGSSKLSAHFDGQSALDRKGLANMPDNFIAEAFVRASTEKDFHYIMQYGSGAHGWSLVRNGKGYQVLLGGIALVGWSGDVPANEWVHVAVVRDNGQTRFYVNGNASGDTNAAPNQAGADSTFAIGSTADHKEFFEGDIDEVRISTFPAGQFDPKILLVNDPEGAAKLAPSARATPAAGKAVSGDASITFEAEPVLNGMTFNRSGLRSETISAENGTKAAWVAQQGSAPDVMWARSVLITLTDPKLREGNQPVCDVTVEFRQTFNSPVELRADTEKGSRNLGGSWGNSNRWNTFTVRLDDAYFGARDHGHKPSDMDTDGYDLRVNSFGGDFAIRSVSIKAYDLRDNPDFKRLVRFDGLSTENDLLIFAPGTKHTVDYTFSNLAFKQADLTYTYEILDQSGRVRANLSGPFSVTGRSHNAISVPIDTAGLEFGAYRTHLTVSHGTQGKLYEREGGFVVANNTPVARAQPGEFLYGLDVTQGAAYNSPRLIKWMQFMGVDIIRNGFGADGDLNETTEKMPIFEQAGLGVMLMCDPPKDQNRRAEQLPGKLDFLKQAAARFSNVKFFELGNEPDLKFFYPGPMANYVEDFQKMADAVREGNPNAVVLNAGLSFAGAEGNERSREFIDLVDVSKLGAWSYHGHGPGMAAEENAFNRIRNLTRAAGKDTVPYADTESGVAARTPQQEIVQARTVVQKMTFAQSVKSPFLMFFRLFMFEEGYGMLYSEQEAKPSVAAYSNLVRTMRGQTFESLLTGVPDGVRAFMFSNTAKDVRSVVLWSDTSGVKPLQLTLGGPGAKVSTIDLYGNTTDVTPLADGSFTVNVGPDPMYVKWTTDAAAPALAVVPLSIDVPSVLVVRSTGDDTVPVTITSRSGQPVVGTLKLQAGERSGVTFASTEMPVNVPAGESQTISVPVVLGQADTSAVQWPTQWTAFIDVNDNDVKAAELKEIPDTLPGAGGTVTGRQVVLMNDRMDFEALGGKMREHATAIVMAHVQSDRDQIVRVGASADWWMQWFVNGEEAYSTLANGNGGGYAITDHTFNLKLKQGDNLVVIRQQSGSMGWKLLIGSPARLTELTTDLSKTGLTFTLDQPGRAAQTRVAGLRRTAPLAAWAMSGEKASVSDFDKVQPDFVLFDHVTNAFASQPDSSKWWKGPADLSGRGWVRQRGASMVVALAVTDDTFTPSTGAVDQGDGVRVSLTTMAGHAIDVDLVPTASGTVNAVVHAAGKPEQTDDSVTVSATVERVGEMTFYQIDLTPRDATSRPDFMNVTVYDQDDFPGKQFVTLAPQAAGGLDGWMRIVW